MKILGAAFSYFVELKAVGERNRGLVVFYNNVAMSLAMHSVRISNEGRGGGRKITDSSQTIKRDLKSPTR